ncbi:hypothetical protein B0T16DRAFT_430222 [Cercophora newfieldiana]|uniref:Nephrocystin 3-like N-terminal domain-containing protein n=1 Tax=Cercophora newfieldiana TaxID=92897 RepID=A0AA39Y0G3_9PEZI|nr:hypothetical protein B0T16DRAFT_430222 [Cercophora newfieldiana]
MDDRLRDIDVAAAGTCEWLLQHETYASWLESDTGLLWIRGKPGSGKSTLLRHAFNDATQNHNGTLVLSFFFHGRGNNLQKTLLGFFRSLAYQLFCEAPNSFADLISTFHERCEKMGDPGAAWNWHERELQTAVQASISKVLRARNIQLFADALDEAGEDAAVELADIFKTWLQESPDTPSRWQICFSCRHYPIIDIDYGFQIHPEHENDGDIRTYVTAQGSRLSKNVQKAIINGASGVFMWARLTAARALTLQRQGFGEETIRAKINATPKELSKLYSEIVHDLAQRDDKSCLRLIQWICFAARPLTSEELRWAMIIGPNRQYKSFEECKQADDYGSNMEKRVRFLGGGLTELTASEPPVVQFIHQSVSDFFLAEGLWKLAGLPVPAEPNSAMVNLDGIKSEAEYELSATYSRDPDSRFGIHWKPPVKFPFLDYTQKSWTSHMGGIAGRSLIEAILKFIDWPSGSAANMSTHLAAPLDNTTHPKLAENNVTLLSCFSRFGLSRLLEVGFEMTDPIAMDIDSLDDAGVTALHRACAGGHAEAATLLLTRGASPDVRAEAESYEKQYTALHYSASKRDINVAQILLDHGADVNAKTAKAETPLSLVVFWSLWSDEEANARLLLKHGADVNAQDAYGETPLHHRAWSGEGPNPLWRNGSASRRRKSPCWEAHGADHPFPRGHGNASFGARG